LSEIVVAIPTFKRPAALARLLAALEQLDIAERVIVVVADNDAADHEGYDYCRSLAAHYRWPLEPVIAERRGIAQVRNVLVERALAYPGARAVAMIDDDEWPCGAWLTELLKEQTETGADVVEGSILFEGGVADAQEFDGVNDMRRPTGPVAMLEGAGNILITRACLERLAAPWFDPAFALTGGEDRDFFERVKAAGGRFAWADAALAYTAVPEHRHSLRWLLARAYGIGNAEMHIFLKYRPGLAARLAEGTKIAGALIIGPFAGLAMAVAPARAAGLWRRVFRNAGKFTALLGLRYQAYAVSHGD
jgi:glycosyltransferase involved in cell wall biosynthesis